MAKVLGYVGLDRRHGSAPMAGGRRVEDHMQDERDDVMFRLRVQQARLNMIDRQIDAWTAKH